MAPLDPELLSEIEALEERISEKWRSLFPEQCLKFWKESIQQRWSASHQDDPSSVQEWNETNHWILTDRPALSEETLIEINARLTRSKHPGFRTETVGNPGIRYAPPEEIVEAVKNTFEEFSRDQANLITIAKFAQQLLTIHPFLDGNGRSVRLLMDLALLHANYPPPYFEIPLDFLVANSWKEAPKLPLEHAVRSLGWAIEKRLDRVHP